MSFYPFISKSVSDKRPPSRAIILGVLGLIPFAITLAAMMFGPEHTRGQAEVALLGYGAVILSFLGGIWWGMAASNNDRRDRKNLYYLLSVLPSLIGWLGAMMGGTAGFVILALGFAMVLVIDNRLQQLRLFPGWWMKLRAPLSICVICVLGVAAVYT